METNPSRWPICGRCCDIAPYSWLGQPHRCVGNARRSVAPTGSVARRAGNFAHCLAEAIDYGERSFSDSTGLDAETRAAIGSVAAEFPNASASAIASAHEAFARDIRGVHYNESHAVRVACRAGEIAQRARPDPGPTAKVDADPRSAYGPDSITVIDPDPTAARQWVLSNRANPSDLYRRYVLDGNWPRTCVPPRSYVVDVPC